MHVVGITNCFLHVRGSLHGWGGQRIRGKVSVVVLLNKPTVNCLPIFVFLSIY